MKKGFTTFLSALKANTPPCKKGHPSLRFLSLFLILFLAVGNAWGALPLTAIPQGTNSLTNAEGALTTWETNTKNTVIYDDNEYFMAWSNGNALTIDGTGFKIGNSSKKSAIVFYVSQASDISVGVARNGSDMTVSLHYMGTSISELTDPNKDSDGGGVKCDEVAISNSENKGTLTKANGEAGYYKIFGTLRFYATSITITPSASAGGDPVDPTFTYTPATYTIGEPALDLSTKLTSNSSGAISFAVSTADAGTTNASISNGKDFTATAVGTATITVTQAEATGYNAKTQDIAVSVVEPDPCATYFWFFSDADQTANGKTNATSVFSNMVGGGSNLSGSITIDETTYNVTRRTGDADPLGEFTVPANKVAMFYALAVSSGDGARKIVLTNTTTSATYEADVAGGNTSYKRVQIDNIAPGTYSIGKSGGNTRLGMVALKVCDATFRTITFDSNGGSTVADLSVLDGTTAIQPTDPERGKYTFLGWFVGDTDNEYVWSTAVTGDLTLKAHWQDPWTITFDADGGSAVSGITVKHNTKAEKPTDPTKDANDFLGWFYGDPAVEFDWNTNVTQNYALVAHWQPAVAKYDVEYYDGETNIGTEEQVWANQHPTAAGIETAKPLYTFVGWYLTSALEGDPVALNTVTPVEGLKLYGKWTKTYATSYDMEEYAVSDGASLATLLENLTAAGYAYTNVNGIDNGHTHNYIYDGMKYKTNDGDLSFNVNADKLVIVKTGNLPANALTMYINGEADPTVFVGANEDVETHVNNYFYSAVEALYRLDIKASKGTCAIKAVTITNPFTVSFEAHGDADPADMQGTPSVTLPTPTNGSASFLGWFTEEAGGTKIGDAGDTYTPTKDITLYAQWEAISTDTRIKALTYKIGTGEEINIYEDGKNTFDIVLPYANSYEAITVAATPRHDAATIEGTITQPTSVPGTATFTVVAQDDNTKQTYTINFAKAPKDGVEIIRATHTGEKTANVTGTIGGTYDKNTQDGGKLGSNGHYLGIKLAEGSFLAGDVVKVVASTLNGGNTATLFSDKGENAIASPAIDEASKTATHVLTGSSEWIYLYRATDDCNPTLGYIAVYRAINPILKAITIDGRDGVIDPLDDKHFTVTIPNEADLDNLTIVPTIVRNAPHATTPEQVMTNSGEWVLTEDGNNTYRIMDKDGDYTDYTITLIRDVLKHTVSFNTHGGSAIDPVQVVDGQKLAAAPADPTKEDYIFKHWSLTDGGEEVDITTVQITENKEFHAVWAPDGAIKLLNGATVNHTNFITGVAASKVTISEVEYDCVTFTGGVGDHVNTSNIKNLDRHVTYNATTTQTKFKLSLYNSSSNNRTIYVKGVVEGSTEEEALATIQLAGNEQKTTEWIEFNNAKNRSIYIFVSSNAGDIKILQEKIIESGDALKMAGEAGYSINLNKGRMFGASAATILFEGLTYTLGGDYTTLSSTTLKVKSNSIVFDVTVPTLLKVTTANAKTYYVGTAADATTNETAKSGVSEFDLTAGTWYINAGSSEVQFTNIAFTAPKCDAPVFNALANSDICSDESYVALDGTATVTDGGTVTYKWYAEGADESDPAAVLDTDAEYTPGADGAYYVVATNSLAGYTDNVVQSEVVTVTTHTGTAISEGLVNQRGVVDDVVTLTVTASGKDLHYTWKECATIGGTYTDVVGAADAASLDVTITEGLNKYYKVIVHSDCGEDQESIAKVEQFVPVVQQNVTGSTVWDWTKAASVNEIKLTDATTPKKNEGFVMANGAATVYNNANFESDKLYLEGEYIIRTEGGKLFQGKTIKFNTTIDGAVRVTFSHTGKNKPARELFINGVGTGTSVTGTSQTETGLIEVPAGEVAITAFHVNPTDGAGQQYVRVYKIEFLALGHRREASWIVPNELGTVCLKDECIIKGAELYELQGPDANRKLVFDEITSGELEAGKPYLFNATATGRISFYNKVNAAHTETAGSLNGMYGTFEDLTFSPTTDQNIYYFSGHNIWAVKKNTADVLLPAYLCYVKMDELLASPIPDANPAPGRRRVTLGVNGQQVATGVDQVQGDEVPTKMIINGQLFILRGEKMYDAQGKLVK